MVRLKPDATFGWKLTTVSSAEARCPCRRPARRTCGRRRRRRASCEPRSRTSCRPTRPARRRPPARSAGQWDRLTRRRIGGFTPQAKSTWASSRCAQASDRSTPLKYSPRRPRPPAGRLQDARRDRFLPAAGRRPPQLRHALPAVVEVLEPHRVALARGQRDAAGVFLLAVIGPVLDERRRRSPAAECRRWKTCGTRTRRSTAPR